MHAPKLISEFYSDHPSAIRTLGIKEPLFLPDDNLSPFQSPLSSVTATPCPSPTREPTSPEQSSLPLEPPTELSSFDSIPPTTTSMYSPPSSIEKCSTPSSYGPIFSQTQLLATLISTTRQSQSPLTAERPSVACNRRTLTSFKEIQEQTQLNEQIQKKRKTLQLLPTNPPPLTPIMTPTSRSPSPSQQATADQDPLMEIAKTLVKMKNLHLDKKKTTAAKDTEEQSMALTKAQELCIKQFRIHQALWEQHSKKHSDLAMAKHYRLTSASMALYIFVIHPRLYQNATSALRAAGKQYPNPLTSTHGRTATNPKFTNILRQQTRKPRIRVEPNALGGASCYDPPQFFSSIPIAPATAPPAAHAPAPPPAVQPIPVQPVAPPQSYIRTRPPSPM